MARRSRTTFPDGDPAARASGGRPARARFGPEPIALFPLLICLLGTLPAASAWPALVWLPLLPLLAAVWVLRARVLVAPDGVSVCNGLGRRTVPWDDVRGFDVPRRGRPSLLHADGRTLLTAVPRREVRRLVAASQVVTGSATGAADPAPHRD